MPIGLHFIWRETERDIWQEYEDKTFLQSLHKYLLKDTTSGSSRQEN
jgi:hypothetical protein